MSLVYLGFVSGGDGLGRVVVTDGGCMVILDCVAFKEWFVLDLYRFTYLEPDEIC